MQTVSRAFLGQNEAIDTENNKVRLCVPRIMNTEWGNYFINHLIQSGAFEIEYEEFPGIQNLGRRGGSLKPLRYNDKLVFIDDWDYANPTSQINNEFFEHNPYYRDIAVILKVQFSNLDKHQYPSIPVIPFLMFPRNTFPLSVFNWQEGGDYITSFSGKGWRNRVPWIAKLGQMQDVYMKVENPNPNVRESYFDMLQKNKWGLILKGKGNGGKNRREVEYMSCGMPLALNYIPEYPFEFVPNEDYLYLEEPEDLEKLYTVDPVPFSKRSIENYNKFFSPEANIVIFKRIIESLV